jgi:hypothetical protein
MDHDPKPHFQVFSVRPTWRIVPDGHTIMDLVIEIIQSRYGYFDAKIQEKADKAGMNTVEEKPDFVLRGGCTLLINPQDSEIRYCIYKTMSDERLKSLRDFLTGDDSYSQSATYFGDPRKEYYRNHIQAKQENRESSYESFSFLHRSHLIEEVE